MSAFRLIPQKPTDFDDGLLTASQVAQLKLNADWVVLSACNTIAGDSSGAEALSGLARAFFYAGARTLLVSHWWVDSKAVERLTISTFHNLKTDASIGRAEAVRRAMVAYLSDRLDPSNAYPTLWGPFELVGEGAGHEPIARHVCASVATSHNRTPLRFLKVRSLRRAKTQLKSALIRPRCVKARSLRSLRGD